MGTNLEDWEREAMAGWIGSCFKKLRQIKEGEDAKLTPEEAEFLRIVLDGLEHISVYGDGYARWQATRIMNMGKHADLDHNTEMF